MKPKVLEILRGGLLVLTIGLVAVGLILDHRTVYGLGVAAGIGLFFLGLVMPKLGTSGTDESEEGLASRAITLLVGVVLGVIVWWDRTH